MHGHSARENREAPSTPGSQAGPGRLEKAVSRTSNMHVDGESDGRVLPTKGPNADDRQSAEAPEGRRPTKENTEQTTAPRTQSRTSALSGLPGVRGVARKGKQVRFTALLHHVTVGQLQASFYALKRARAGRRRCHMDGVRDGP
jgi:RNA-directed DNA polymerase